MRLFYGIPLSPTVRAHFSELRKTLLLQHIPDLQRLENLHITLAFLGEVAAGTIRELGKIGAELAKKHPPLALRLGSMGTFGRGYRRILWQGVEESHFLSALVEDLWNKLQDLGFAKEERPYRPHITLSRKAVGIPDLEKTRGFPQLEVPEFCLYHSHRVQGKLTYTPINRFQLSKISKIY
jgi:2'-5' RNA ligase